MTPPPPDLNLQSSSASSRRHDYGLQRDCDLQIISVNDCLYFNYHSEKKSLDQCSQYIGNPQCFFVPVLEPALSEPEILEEYVPPCEDLPQCVTAADQGICLNECWER